jgi:hypothetical protein
VSPFAIPGVTTAEATDSPQVDENPALQDWRANQG